MNFNKKHQVFRATSRPLHSDDEKVTDIRATSRPLHSDDEKVTDSFVRCVAERDPDWRGSEGLPMFVDANTRAEFSISSTLTFEQRLARATSGGPEEVTFYSVMLDVFTVEE